MNVMQYSEEYWNELKKNNSEVTIIGASRTDHDILCRLFKYAVVNDDNDGDVFIQGYTNYKDVTLRIGECLVNIETREVVKDNRSY